MLRGKRILVGVGGGIAVYKAAELVRLLQKQGAEVRCAMTRAATEFVTPLTFEALTGEAVQRELFDLTAEREMGHIKLARWADLVIVAPATANLLAKLAHGVADDLLTTLMQVREGAVLIAPAMNVSMWQSAATQRNAESLRARGFAFVGPEAGELACGETGAGRLADLDAIVQAAIAALTPPTLAGQHWVIDAGPTREHWDAVRFLANGASGRLGAEIARAAALHGARVTLIAGPGTPKVEGVVRIDVCSGQQMLAAALQAAADADCFVASAAVSDYRFAEPAAGKLKRGEIAALAVQLVANPDIVATVAAMVGRPRKVIAFAAEVQSHLASGRDKLKRKGADALFANDVANMGQNMAGGWWLTETGEEQIAPLPKEQLAWELVQRIAALGD